MNSLTSGFGTLPEGRPSNRGAFKFRGACNAVQSLSEEQKQRGVVTHSSGNHALSIALAASLAGIPAYIVVPSNTPQVLLAQLPYFNPSGNRYALCARQPICDVQLGKDV